MISRFESFANRQRTTAAVCDGVSSDQNNHGPECFRGVTLSEARCTYSTALLLYISIIEPARKSCASLPRSAVAVAVVVVGRRGLFPSFGRRREVSDCREMNTR